MGGENLYDWINFTRKLLVTICRALVHSCSYSLFSTGIFPLVLHILAGTFLQLLFVLYWNIPAGTICSPLEHSCCYCLFYTGIFLLVPHILTGTFLQLLFVLHWNIPAGTSYPHWNIPAVTVCSPLEYSCWYYLFSTGTVLLLLFVLHWNIPVVTVCFPLEDS